MTKRRRTPSDDIRQYVYVTCTTDVLRSRVRLPIVLTGHSVAGAFREMTRPLVVKT